LVGICGHRSQDKLAALKDEIALRRAMLELPSEEYVSML
jgi:hypothetical protein